jgi:hypothetical protein
MPKIVACLRVQVYDGYMTTYKCSQCGIEFPKVSSVKRHQTRKHKGEVDLAVIEILEGGTEQVLVEEQPAVKPRAKAAKPSVKAVKPKAKAKAVKTRAKAEAKPAETSEIQVTVHSNDTVTINRDLFETLMKIAGVPVS